MAKRRGKKNTAAGEFVQKNTRKITQRRELAARRKNFYEHPLVILFVTFLFFPIGLYLFYRYGEYAKRTKLMTIAGVLVLVCGIMFYSLR